MKIQNMSLPKKASDFCFQYKSNKGSNLLEVPTPENGFRKTPRRETEKSALVGDTVRGLDKKELVISRGIGQRMNTTFALELLNNGMLNAIKVPKRTKETCDFISSDPPTKMNES